MATALSDSGDDSLDESSGLSDSLEDSDVEVNCQSGAKQKPCKYYNKGHCKDGSKCLYLHVCQYAQKGNCRYGSKCKLKHSPSGSGSSHATNLVRSTSKGEEVVERRSDDDPKLTNGRKYQWQLDDGSGWRDIENDHIIEAQYCLPHTKSIKIYNTPHGAVSIDYNRMRVRGKNLSVRRLDDGTTTWVWYCTLRHKWREYGDKDSKGNTGPVTSSDIEKRFQSNPEDSFAFSIGSENLEIKFREMQQVGKKRNRKVTRRPVYRQPAIRVVPQVTRAFQNMSVANKPQWEFEGGNGRWHMFKHRNGTCSVSNDDIERSYQQNRSGHMTFTVNAQTYNLDFGAMIQTNLATKKTRKIRRV
ncbi:protein mono-ADP-ribosyltransferase PARP12 isoform X1 [Channa argus]|uniref:protein mono-ADP-ribosyltransferase PARP12 isoform X1 n=1 Tax=Channa argus TaxID=215402 RepID=UPI003521CF06